MFISFSNSTLSKHLIHQQRLAEVCVLSLSSFALSSSSATTKSFRANMPPGREDDAASGIFTYDGSFASSAQNTENPGDASLADASFAAKVAAEDLKIAKEFDLPLGVYGFGGNAPSTNGSYRTDDVASTYSGVFDMDESSFVRGVSADAAFEAQERAEELERSRSSGSKGEDTKTSGVGDCIGDYDVPAKTSSESEASRATEEKGILNGLVRTMVSMGLAWGTVKGPETPETTDKTSTPTGSHQEEAAPAPGDGSVSILSFDGPEGKVNEVNSTTSGSRVPLFKGQAVTRSYKERLAAYNSRNYPERNVADNDETKPPLLNPARLITICSCVVLFAVALAVGGWIAISRRGESEASKATGNSGFDDDEIILGALTQSPTATLTVSPESTDPEAEDPPCGEDSISVLFEINNELYDCIWFSERTLPYRKVMCEMRPDIADACRQTCSGKCGPTAAPTMQLDETSEPTGQPTVAPSVVDTEAPTAGSTVKPSLRPTLGPTGLPTSNPSARPQTGVPTAAATLTPTTTFPVASPTLQPTRVATTGAPFASPTRAPVAAPTQAPVAAPTRAPVAAPTRAPVQTRAPVPAPVRTEAPSSLTLVCPPDNPGFIPGSTTTCAQFALFHPDFRAQRCQPGWPVYTFCYASCNSCFYV